MWLIKKRLTQAQLTAQNLMPAKYLRWLVFITFAITVLSGAALGVYLGYTQLTQAAATTCYWVGDTNPANWNDATHWSSSSGGGGSSCDGGVVPGSDDTVIFDGAAPNGNNNCTIDTAVNVAGINIQAGYSGTITQSGTNTVTVGSSNFSQAAGTFTGGSGTIDINGTFTISGGAFTSTSGTMYIGGAWTHTAGGTFTHNSGTVEFDGGTYTIDVGAGGETFYNFIHNGGSKAIASGDTLTVIGTATLTNGYLYTGTLDVQNALSHVNTYDGGNAIITITGAGTRTINLAGEGALPAVTLNAPNVTMNGPTSGTVTFQSVLTIQAGTYNANNTTFNSWFTHTAGGTFNSGSGTVTFALNNATINVINTETFDNLIIYKNDGQTLTIAAGDTLIATGTLTLTDGAVGTGTIQAQGSVTIGANFDGGNAILQLTGGNTQTLTDNGGTEPTGTITINKTAGTAVNLGANFTLGTAGQDLTVTQGILNLAGYNLVLTAAGDILTVASNGTLQLQGGETVTASTKTLSGTVIYNGTGTYTTSLAAGNNYSNLTFNGSGGVWEPNGAVSVSGALTITAGTFDIDGQNLTVSGIFSNTNNGTLRLTGGETTVTLTMDTDSGTIEYDGGGSYSSLKLSNSYYNLTFNNASGSWQPSDTLDINGDLTITAGTLNTNGKNITIVGSWTNSGTFTHGSATVTFDGTSSGKNITAGSSSFNNLTINGSGGWTLNTNDLTVAGNFTITNGTLATGGKNITVGGNWSNSGTFTHGNATVTLNGTNQTISGSTTFYNLSKTVTSAYTLTFTASTTQTVAGTLTLQGASGQLLSLRSSSSGTQWNLALNGSASVDYVDVKDSNLTGTGITVSNGTDSGNNSSLWSFPSLADHYTLTSSSSYQTPGASFTVTITLKNSSGDTVTTQSGDVNLIFSGPSSINGYNPKAKDKEGRWKDFGTTTSVTFSSGTANVSVQLFKSQSTSIDVTDENYSSTGRSNYDLDVTVLQPSGTIVINDGADWSSRSVTLKLTSTRATQVKISNSSDFSGASYEDIPSTKSWTLGGNDGQKYVYAKFQDSYGNESDTASDSLYMDVTPPTISINPPSANYDTKLNLYYIDSTSPQITGKVFDNLMTGKVEVTLSRANRFLGIISSYSVIEIKTLSLTPITSTSASFAYTPTNSLDYGTRYRLSFKPIDYVQNEGTAENLDIEIVKPSQLKRIQFMKKLQIVIPKLQEKQALRLQKQAEEFKKLSWIGNELKQIARFIGEPFQKLAMVINKAIGFDKAIQQIAEFIKTPLQKLGLLDFLHRLKIACLTFVSLVADPNPTQITDVRIESVSPRDALISWKTNHYTTNNKVNYGKTLSYGKAFYSLERANEHQFTLTGLEPGETYYFEVMSQNKNYVYDSYYSFTTPKEGEEAETITTVTIKGAETDIVNIRRAPSFQSQIIGSVKGGDRFRVWDFSYKEKGWVKIQHGWVSLEFVNVD